MPGITPYVMVDDAQIYRKFLESTFDAEIPVAIPLDSDPRRLIHAEARIGEGTLYFADSGPTGGRCLESPSEPVHVQLWATVPDAERAFERAVAAGATPARAVETQEDGSRMGGFMDPFGTLWWVSTPA
ncbi:VOC family protein [Nocardia sp. NPDC127526]|uniref:VOC family protein n=1 Tax=Nocardia sp. NPDC127526 TaxID=3345393 RepID=UPI003627173C